jgi:hypothetical protein
LNVLFDLEKLGYENPNTHRTLEEFEGFYKLKYLSTYALRRDYVSKLYGEIIVDIERLLRGHKDSKYWIEANEVLNDELSPIRTQWLKAKNYIYSEPPDFENSIKESISSVESLLKIIENRPKDSLGKIISTLDIDDDIKKLISKAYGLLSNKDFVRHGGTEIQDIGVKEAKFFLEFAAISIIYLKEKLKRDH